jgi:hypothetical protein
VAELRRRLREGHTSMTDRYRRKVRGAPPAGPEAQAAGQQGVFRLAFERR